MRDFKKNGLICLNKIFNFWNVLLWQTTVVLMKLRTPLKCEDLAVQSNKVMCTAALILMWTLFYIKGVLFSSWHLWCNSLQKKTWIYFFIWHKTYIRESIIKMIKKNLHLWTQFWVQLGWSNLKSRSREEDKAVKVCEKISLTSLDFAHVPSALKRSIFSKHWIVPGSLKYVSSIKKLSISCNK